MKFFGDTCPSQIALLTVSCHQILFEIEHQFYHVLFVFLVMAVAIDKHIEILTKTIPTGSPIPVHKAASPPPPVITVAVINV